VWLLRPKGKKVAMLVDSGKNVEMSKNYIIDTSVE